MPLTWLRMALAAAVFGLPVRLSAFLEANEPARAAALGGNLVADPQGPAALAYNPAGLGSGEATSLWARYQSLFSGVEGDSLGSASLALKMAPSGFGGLGVGWEHFGNDNLQQDRLRLGWGLAWQGEGDGPELRLGLNLDYLNQSVTLDPVVGFAQTQNVGSQGLDFGAGLQALPLPYLSIGISVENLAQANLGVIGTDRVPRRWRFGAGFTGSLREPGDLRILISEMLEGSQAETQAGMEWKLPGTLLWLRGGGDRYHAAVGLGFSFSALRLDYAYQFSGGAAAGLPGSHALELGYRFRPSSGDAGLWVSARRVARRQAAKGDWQRALHSMDLAVELNPSDKELKSEREEMQRELQRARGIEAFEAGKAALRRGDYYSAGERFKSALSLDPDEPKYRRAMVEYEAQRPKGALADPRVQVLVDRAGKAKSLGHSQETAEALKEATDLYPDDEALKALIGSWAGDSAPGRGQILTLLLEADLYVRRNRADLARQNWKRVLEIEPGNAVALQKLRDGELAKGKAPKGKGRSLAEASYQRGLKAYFRGDLDDAINAWEEALKLDPTHARAQNSLLRARLEQEGNHP